MPNKRARHFDSLKPHIREIIKRHTGADVSVSEKALNVLDKIAFDVISKIASSSSSLVNSSKKRKTVSLRDITASVRMNMPGNVSVGALRAAESAVNKYRSSKA